VIGGQVGQPTLRQSNLLGSGRRRPRSRFYQEAFTRLEKHALTTTSGVWA
jgi:hypothetical protein